MADLLWANRRKHRDHARRILEFLDPNPKPFLCPDCGERCEPDHDSHRCDYCGVVW